jgi:hypothetical protein
VVLGGEKFGNHWSNVIQDHSPKRALDHGTEENHWHMAQTMLRTGNYGAATSFDSCHAPSCKHKNATFFEPPVSCC